MASAATIMAISAVASAGTAVYQATKSAPKIPTGPDKIATGNIAPEAAAATFKEDETANVNKRAIARKGASAYRIPLETKTTGIATTGSTGLKI